MWICAWIQRVQRNFIVSVVSVVLVSTLFISTFLRKTSIDEVILHGSKRPVEVFKPTFTTNNDIVRPSSSLEPKITPDQLLGATKKPTWLDTTAILEGVLEELQSVGWEGPNGSIALRIKDLKLRKPTKIKEKKATTHQGEEDIEILAVSERWKVMHVGCFYESQTSTALMLPQPPVEVTSASECIMKCSRTKTRYVSISGGKFCRCGKRVSTTVLGIDAADDKCNMNCEQESLRSCGGDKYASVYHVQKHKMERFSAESIRSTSAGCFKKPKKLDKFFELRNIKQDPNAAWCLLNCERANFPIASWEKSGECRCGKFTPAFTLSAMGSKTDDRFCDGNTKDYVMIMRTYSSDERCDRRVFLPSAMGRLIALASYPGSGNTWTRHLIESGSGIYSGSVYGDVVLFADGFLGEKLSWKSRRTSVIKTHKEAKEEADKFEEAIIIVRNPYDAIIAEFNRIRGGHTGYAETELFNTMEWVYFVAFGATRWFSTIENYSALEKVLVVYFEEMVANPIVEVRKMVDFLNYPTSNLKERLACLESNLSGDFKRKKKELPFDPYLQKSKNIVNMCIKTARELLQSRNLPPLPMYER